jgi:hypothetical protein
MDFRAKLVVGFEFAGGTHDQDLVFERPLAIEIGISATDENQYGVFSQNSWPRLGFRATLGTLLTRYR